MTAHLQHAYRGGYQGRPGWWLELSYSEDAVEALKAAVPAPDRTWDELKKQWWVSDDAVDATLKVVPALAAHLAQKALL